MRSFDVGQRFLRYYQDNGFKFLPGTSLLDPSVPMTFVMSAGLGQIEALAEQGNQNGNRYVLLQKCFRHFDLDKIGKSNVHLSLFEMPGAFSFGQDSREKTLERIWLFLTEELGLDRRRLWATYFAGGEILGHQLDADEETCRAWQRIGLPSSRIVALGVDDNFWKQGAGISGKVLRKCGPTTEVFFDHGPEWGCGPDCRPGCGCDRFIEFVNSLFIFSRVDEKTQSLITLDEPFTETVIGNERAAMLLQGKSSVFEIESIAPLIEWVQSFHKRRFSHAVDGVKSERVIVDYIRALVFLTADGAPAPGKGGRHRIMRMLIRGALTHQKVLGIADPSFVPSLIDATAQLYQSDYPEVKEGHTRLLTYLATEVERFEKTLSKAHRQLDRLIQREGNGSISGEQALKLVKNHGFRLPLLEFTLAQKGIQFSRQEYEQALARWR
jgi:alanyl-tRNA synthetase